jgi:hypothetical protein
MNKKSSSRYLKQNSSNDSKAKLHWFTKQESVDTLDYENEVYYPKGKGQYFEG